MLARRLSINFPAPSTRYSTRYPSVWTIRPQTAEKQGHATTCTPSPSILKTPRTQFWEYSLKPSPLRTKSIRCSPERLSILSSLSNSWKDFRQKTTSLRASSEYYQRLRASPNEFLTTFKTQPRNACSISLSLKRSPPRSGFHTRLKPQNVRKSRQAWCHQRTSQRLCTRSRIDPQVTHGFLRFSKSDSTPITETSSIMTRNLTPSSTRPATHFKSHSSLSPARKQSYARWLSAREQSISICYRTMSRSSFLDWRRSTSKPLSTNIYTRSRKAKNSLNKA